MIYRVRTTSGAVYLTKATEPAEAIKSKSTWATITFAMLSTGVGTTMMLRGSALESVEIIPDEEITRG